jgi:hypothetical protein
LHPSQHLGQSGTGFAFISPSVFALSDPKWWIKSKDLTPFLIATLLLIILKGIFFSPRLPRGSLSILLPGFGAIRRWMPCPIVFAEIIIAAIVFGYSKITDQIKLASYPL